MKAVNELEGEDEAHGKHKAYNYPSIQSAEEIDHEGFMTRS
jgi:hypothetical protein